MWVPPLASPGNIDWQLIVPRQQAFGIGSWIPIIKPGNCGWLYVYMVAGGAGGSGGATGAIGTARAGGGSGASGQSAVAMIPWATLPDVIYACPGLGGTAGTAGLGSGGGGNNSAIQIEPIGTLSSFHYVLEANGGLPPSGTSGANATLATAGGYSHNRGITTIFSSTAGATGGATAAGANMPPFNNNPFCGGASGAGTTTGNANAAGGGLFTLFTGGPGQIIGSTSGSGGEGGGAAGGGAGKSGKELGQSPGSPLDLFQLTGNSRPLFFCGGCGGGSNGAAAQVGGKGGDGDWGGGGGGGGAGVTGGVGGKGGDGFIIIGNF